MNACGCVVGTSPHLPSFGEGLVVGGGGRGEFRASKHVSRYEVRGTRKDDDDDNDCLVL